MKYPRLRFCLPLILFTAAWLRADEAITPRETLVLFNGRDLSGWERGAPVGQTPVEDTWRVADGVIQCKGEPIGYIRTAERYRNYRLTVEWRWTGPALPPDAQGRPRRRNSGVLLHGHLPGTEFPDSVEAQLAETRAGDFYFIGATGSAEQAARRDKAVTEATASGDAKALKRAQNIKGVPRQKDSSEKDIGEWNRYEIVCAGDTVTLTVNGIEQNRATKTTVDEGYIILQSEGGAVEFRNIRLDPLP